jgi:L-cysteine desulfidase
MEEIILLAVQICGVIACFVGVASAMSWYHGGGKKDGKSSGRSLSGKNL